jgi:hypothetical protein
MKTIVKTNLHTPDPSQEGSNSHKDVKWRLSKEEMLDNLFDTAGKMLQCVGQLVQDEQESQVIQARIRKLYFEVKQVVDTEGGER